MREPISHARYSARAKWVRAWVRISSQNATNLKLTLQIWHFVDNYGESKGGGVGPARRRDAEPGSWNFCTRRRAEISLTDSIPLAHVAWGIEARSDMFV